jgi:small GTP-binding protein
MNSLHLMKKVCLIGDPGVGKTSLVRRFVHDIFDDSYLSTIGAKVVKKALCLERPERNLNINLSLMVWDIAGQSREKMFHGTYLSGIEGGLVVADITRPETFTSLEDAVAMVQRLKAPAPLVFLLNKADLGEPTASDLKAVRTLASKNSIPVLATSAKTGMNVEKAFSMLGQMIVDVYLKQKYG